MGKQDEFIHTFVMEKRNRVVCNLSSFKIEAIVNWVPEYVEIIILLQPKIISC